MTKTSADSLKERLGRRSKRNGACLIWTGAKSEGGYGVLKRYKERRNIMAHRAAYELYIGRIKKGMTIDHVCRNRACVNPKHLEMVTRGENVLRGIGLAAVNARKIKCKRGHRFTEANTYTNSGQRHCRICHALHEQHRRDRMKHAS